MRESKFLAGKEILSLLLSALILGFIFSFREWGYGQNFSFQIGIINLIRTAIISMIVLLIYQLAHKLVALRNGAYTKYSIWGLQRYWFRAKSKFKKPIKIGLFLPILLALISNGFIKFAAVGCSELKEITHRRLGKEYKHLTEYQTAVIHLAGPITLILLATLLSPIETFSKLVMISYSVAIFSMIPLSKLDGAKVFFGSVPLYVFSIVLMLAAMILINVANPIVTLILSLILAITLFIIFLHKHR
ncbi:MAG: hypothetical protein ABIH25_02620 [Candidatus Woesearchaeota archaeon]